jgi:uncharacterized protein YdaU (DUF1376 family)
MSSPFWMPLYVRDYLADTRHLTTLQHGAYLLLIMEYWQKGRLPESETTLRAISSLSRNQWLRNRHTLGALFQQPGWRHPRIDAELKKANDLRLKRQVYGASGGRISRGRDNVARFTLVNTDPSKSPTKR